MANIRLVTPFMKNYASAFPVPVHAHSLESWLKITTDEDAPTSDSVDAAFSKLLTDTPKIIPIETALGAPSDIKPMGLYVLSNQSGHLGASIILHPMAVPMLHDILHADDITLIPSSIHELLAIRTGFLGSHELADLTRTIQSINASEVKPEDWLDDQPWILHDGIITRSNYHEEKAFSPAQASAAN